MTKIIEDTFNFDYIDIENILISNAWGDNYSKDGILKTFAGSSYFAIAFLHNLPIGYVRALSDECTLTYLTEIIVHKEYQMQGIGRELLRAFNKRYSHTVVYTCGFNENIDFFKKFGITKKDKLVGLSRRSL